MYLKNHDDYIGCLVTPNVRMLIENFPPITIVLECRQWAIFFY